MRTIFNLIFITIVIVFYCCWLPLNVSANVGGGSGDPISHYIFKQLTEDESTVNRLKTEEAADKTVNFTTVAGKQIFGNKVGIIYSNHAAPLNSIDTAFVGTVDGEELPRRFDFSIVSNITILKKDSKFLTIKLDLFPDISVEELLKIRPTYTDLKETYSRSTIILVPLWSKDKYPLALVGADEDENAPIRVIALFSEIPDGQEIQLIGSRMRWWAIQSVTDDPAYPYRVIYKK